MLISRPILYGGNVVQYHCHFKLQKESSGVTNLNEAGKPKGLSAKLQGTFLPILVRAMLNKFLYQRKQGIANASSCLYVAVPMVM